MKIIPGYNPNPTYFDDLDVATDARLVYYVPNTTLGKAVYNIDGVSIGYKIPCTASGTSNPQIFWGTGDYDVMLQKYVAGDRVDDSSWADVWPHAYRVNGSTESVGVASSFAITNTRAETKLIPEETPPDYVIQAGYLTAGDGGGGMFKWYSSEATSDDGGYVIELNDAPATGRYMWVNQPGQMSVSPLSYGVVDGNVDPVDSALIATNAIAFARRWLLELPSRTMIIQGVVTLTAKTHVPALCKFDALDLLTIRYVIFSGEVIVDERSASYPIDTYDKVGNKNSLTVEIISPMVDVRPEWWDGESLSSSDIVVSRVQRCIDSSAGKIILTPRNYFLPATTIVRDFYAHSGAVVRLAQGPTIIDGAFDTATNYSQGENSGKWHIFKKTYPGYVRFTNNGPKEVQAWWFGWGISSDAPHDILYDAYVAARGFNAGGVLVIGKTDIVGSLGYIKGAVNFFDPSIEVRLASPLVFGSGGSLEWEGCRMPRTNLFTFMEGTDAGIIQMYGTDIYPEWFGAEIGGNAQQSFIAEAFKCAASSSSTVIRWVDLGGSTFNCDGSPFVQNCTYVGLKNGTLNCSGGNYALTFIGCNDIAFKDVTFTNSAYACLALQTCTNVKIYDCEMELNSSSSSFCLILQECALVTVRDTDINCYSSGITSPIQFYGAYVDAKFYNCNFRSIGSDVYLAGTRTTYRRCTFSSFSDKKLYVGWNINGFGHTVSNVDVKDCEISGFNVVIAGVRGVDFDENLVQSNVAPVADGPGTITLEPRESTVDPEVSVWKNKFYHAIKPSTSSNFWLVNYKTTYGGYLLPAAGLLFQNMRIGYNVMTGMSGYNVNIGTFTIQSGDPSLITTVPSALTYKTHGDWILNKSDPNLTLAKIVDFYLGRTHISQASVSDISSPTASGSTIYFERSPALFNIRVRAPFASTCYINGSSKTSARN